MDDDRDDFFKHLEQELYRAGRNAALDNRPRQITMGPFYHIGYDETKQLHMDIPSLPPVM